MFEVLGLLCLGVLGLGVLGLTGSLRRLGLQCLVLWSFKLEVIVAESPVIVLGSLQTASLQALNPKTVRIWGFPKIRGTFLGVPILRTIVY